MIISSTQASANGSASALALHAGIRQRECLCFGTKQMGKGMGRVALGEIMEDFPVLMDKTSSVIHDWTLDFYVP